MEDEKDFSSSVGAKIKSFVDNIPTVISFLKINCLSMEWLYALVKILNVLPDLVTFPEITKIVKGCVNDYPKAMEKCEEQVKYYFSGGGRSF